MRRFLEICTELHLDDVAGRALRLRYSVAANLYECVLFFICGHDFIFDPSDRKFDAINALFLQENGQYALNIYPNCRSAMALTLDAPAVAVHIEGTAEQGPGKWSHAYTQFTHQGGVSPARSAANYNLQTRALELVVTHEHGLSYQGSLEQTIADLKRAFETQARVGHAEAVVSEMRQHLSRLWPTDIHRLGL